MSDTHATTEDEDEPGLYAIRLKGHLDDRWAAWFEGLTITREDNGHTLLTGRVVDQAALHGVLRKVRDLALPLISLTRVSPGQAAASAVQPGVTAGCLERSVAFDENLAHFKPGENQWLPTRLLPTKE